MTIHFYMFVPIVDTSERRRTWNVQLETENPSCHATFAIDVA